MGAQRSLQTDIPWAVADVRAAFAADVTRPYAWRVQQLRALRRMIVEHGPDFEQALFADLHKSPTEAQITETSVVISEIDYALRHLRRWMRPRHVLLPLTVQPAWARIEPEPLGTVLIISPWNYPLQLLLAPLVGAIAAGNAAVLKPSELAPATSRWIAEILPDYLDVRAFRVIEGAVDETTALLDERFDHIFYTGGGRVASVIMSAAAKHLTPVTLELGGKSPVWVDETVDLARAARRIAWTKYLNAGQTCVAPDYVLATPSVASALETHLAAAVHELYGADPVTSPDYGRIVNESHFDRLLKYLGDGRIVFGGHHDRATRFLAPTVLADVDIDSAVLTDEIFGPILPVITVDSLGEAIDFIRAREKPLALYAFTSQRASRARLAAETSSGALVFGAPVIHLAAANLPFGGVGASGMGAYHGKYSFDAFSHERPIMSKPLWPDTLRIIQPPFEPARRELIARFFGHTATRDERS